jgi:hypothetical protein
MRVRLSIDWHATTCSMIALFFHAKVRISNIIESISRPKYNNTKFTPKILNMTGMHKQIGSDQVTPKIHHAQVQIIFVFGHGSYDHHS